jgi:hypothetical protein
MTPAVKPTLSVSIPVSTLMWSVLTEALSVRAGLRLRGEGGRLPLKVRRFVSWRNKNSSEGDWARPPQIPRPVTVRHHRRV